MTRPNWDEYFRDIAKAVAARSTCPRASVGAVIARDNRIISTGYNGSLAGEPHCTEAGCIIKDGHCQRVVHAETNAIAGAAKFGLAVDGATLYLWSDIKIPACHRCSQAIKAAGIVRVVEES